MFEMHAFPCSHVSLLDGYTFHAAQFFRISLAQRGSWGNDGLLVCMYVSVYCVGTGVRSRADAREAAWASAGDKEKK